MPAKLICGICQTTLHVGKEGRGVVIVVCDTCNAIVKAEIAKKIPQPAYLPRPRAA